MTTAAGYTLKSVPRSLGIELKGPKNAGLSRSFRASCHSDELKSMSKRSYPVARTVSRLRRFRGLGAKNSGFMSEGGHLVGVVLLGVALGLIAPFVDKWTDSRLWFWLVMTLTFLPLFVITHAVADYIVRKLF